VDGVPRTLVLTIGSFDDGNSVDENEDNGQRHVSSSEVLSPALQNAWVRIEPGCWRHVVTNELLDLRDSSHEYPERLGPSADDIPEGWKAKLDSQEEEIWKYQHCDTGVLFDVPPKFLPEDVIKQLDVAASHGNIPEYIYCRALFEDDCIKYENFDHPMEWVTTKHPKIIENEMKAYLDNLKANSTKRPEVTLLAGGQELPVDVQTSEIRQLSGILVVTDIGRALVSRLLVAYPEYPLLPFFIFRHFLLRTLNEDETAKELVRQVQGWYRMFEYDGYIDRSWAGNHYDAIHDSDRCKVHFGYAQYLSTRPTGAHMGVVVRLSIFRISTKLSMYLQ